ncbi:hypothetical protein [Clostridium butyricum]|uniref:hypothetical protein n=1 Tax=Clostridium butyricum TaxID=1492 RepID=UPI00325ABD63
MIITLDNGQTTTIYENGNLIKQIEPYIDKEIYELLDKRYGVVEQPLSQNNIRLVTDSEDMIGETIKYLNIVHNGYLDNVIIATNEGSLLVGDIDGSDEYSCPSVNCITNEKQLKYKIFGNEDVRSELLHNNIISKEYIEKINKEREIELKKQEDERKLRKYEEYLKLKKEFEKENN